MSEYLDEEELIDEDGTDAMEGGLEYGAVGADIAADHMAAHAAGGGDDMEEEERVSQEDSWCVTPGMPRRVRVILSPSN